MEGAGSQSQSKPKAKSKAAGKSGPRHTCTGEDARASTLTSQLVGGEGKVFW